MLNDIIFKISELATLSKRYLEETFEEIFVEGEIANLNFSPSGHCYFTLKDNNAQIKSVLFKSLLPYFPLANGMHVLAKATVSLYTPKGDFQLVIHHLKLLGKGTNYKQFILLKNKIEQLGWFDKKYKQPIYLPKILGIITSPQSAVLKDLISTINFPLKIIVYPSLTQGKEAAQNVANAINLANKRNECDLLIIARGGGSYDDLAAFNSEQVAEAIHFSRLPIISAIGHETDFTIADFVADYRALTPTAAAELIVKKHQEITLNLSQLKKIILLKINAYLGNYQQKINNLSIRLKNPSIIIDHKLQLLENLNNILEQKILHYLLNQQNKINILETKLTTLNPELPLKRGFSLLFNPTNNQIISKINQLKKQKQLRIKLQDGECNITLSKI